MSKAKVNRSQSREAALQIVYCQSFTESDLSRAVAGVEATQTLEAFSEATKSLREFIQAAEATTRSLENAMAALKETQKPQPERKTIKSTEATVTTRLEVHQARMEAIESLRRTATQLEGAARLFEEDGFCQRLLKTWDRHRQEVDSAVDRALEGWNLRRLTAEDGSVLRLGATEILYFTDVPGKVIVNEYVELSKKYGDKDAPRLVNGVLDRLMHEHRQEEAQT